jgi:hypothetical protein
MIISSNHKRLLLSVVLFTLFTSNAYSARELVISPYRQWGSNTCWAACSKMVLDAYQFSKTEMEIRKWAFPPNGPDVTNQLSGTTKSTDKVFQNYGPIYSTFTPFNTSSRGGNISQSDLTSEIDRGRPILSGRLIADGSPTGSGHMFLITGYTGSGGSTAGKVIYNDPASGTRKEQTYAEFVRTGNGYIWFETLRLTTNPRFPIPVGTGPKELVRINSGTAEITQSPQSLSYIAYKNGDHIPVNWNWKLIFPHSYGDCIVASWTVTGSNLQSTWNISNFVLPAGYQWKYNFDGKIPGRVEVLVNDNAGPPAHEDAINVLYTPNILYSGIIVYENNTVSNAQPEVKAHELIITQNDQFSPGGNITFKSGERIDINDGVTIQNGSTTNFTIDPLIR